MAKHGGQRLRGGILAQAGGVAASLAVLLLTAPASPSPTPSPTSSPSPSPSPMGTLLVTKTDAITGARVGGTTFRVYDQDDPNKHTLAQLTGNGDGASLPPGPTYCLEETAVPAGYLNAPTFVPRQCNRLDQRQTLTVAVTDPPGGILQVVKTDLSGNTIAASGGSFDVLQGSLTGNVVAHLATDGSGRASVTLDPAVPMYCVVETAAPAGYQVAPTYTPAQCVPVAVGSAAAVSVADPPSPTPTPTPTPTATPAPRTVGELQIVKTDPSGEPVTVPGFTFSLHAGSVSGPVVAGTTTDTSGTAIAAALNPATYCLEETAAPDVYQVAPTYSPGACVAVAADPTRGRNPTTVTVTDPPSPAAASAEEEPTPNATSPRGPSRLGRRGQVSASVGFRPGSLAVALTALGTFLLVAGLAMIAAGIYRRRLAGLEPPPGGTFDTTVG